MNQRIRISVVFICFFPTFSTVARISTYPCERITSSCVADGIISNRSRMCSEDYAGEHINCQKGTGRGNISRGYIKRNTRIAYLTLTVTRLNGTTREILLPIPRNADNTIGDYHSATITNYKWVMGQLGRRTGLRFGDKISIKNFGFPVGMQVPKIDVYDAPQGQIIGSLGYPPPASSSAAQARFICSYEGLPKMISFRNACGNRKICLAKVICEDERGLFAADTACPAARGNSCPTATECAADKEISWHEPVATRQVIDSPGARIPQVRDKNGNIIAR